MYIKMINKPEENIEDWFPIGRTVLLSKTSNLSKEDEYRPITCLNTCYKILTGVIANHMKNHTEANGMWDERQEVR